MGVYKVGKKWQAKRRSHTGEWWSILCARKADAQAHDRDMQIARDTGKPWIHPRDRQVRLTLRRMGEEFILAQQTRLRPRTMHRYRRELESFVSWAEDQGKGDAGALSRSLLRRYYRHLCTSGRWGRARKPQTANKIMRCLHTWWTWAYEHDDELGAEDGIPRPRRIELFAVAPPVTVAPTWSEMDDLIGELEHVEWARRAAWIQRFTAMRIGAVMQLSWQAIDFEADQIRIAPEISKGGYGGRVLPIAKALRAEMERWPVGAPESYVCAASDSTRATSRPARIYRAAWERSGVRRAVWHRQPTHSVRKGVYSGLLGEGAHPDAVDALAGHSLGASRRPYLDAEIAFRLVELVERIPKVGEREDK